MIHFGQKVEKLREVFTLEHIVMMGMEEVERQYTLLVENRSGKEEVA